MIARRIRRLARREPLGSERVDAGHRGLLERSVDEHIDEKDVGGLRHDQRGDPRQRGRVVERRRQKAAHLALQLRGASRGLGRGSCGLLALQHLTCELVGRRQLFRALARSDVAQEPAEVRRLAVAPGERGDRETGHERSPVARAHAHGPLTLLPYVRIVDEPAEGPHIGLVDEQRERLADEEAARDSEHLGRGAIGLQDDPGLVGDDESIRAVVEDLTRRGKVELGPPRLAAGLVPLGAKTVALRGQTGERLLESSALEAQHFQVFGRNEAAHTLDARPELLCVL